MKKYLKQPYLVMLLLVFTLIITAIIQSNDIFEIINGLIKIYISPDILITDYIELAGFSAAFINSAIMGSVYIVLLCAVKHKPNPKTMMAFWLVCGFSLFGKNLINSTPILFGGYLYSRFVKEPYRDNIVTSFLVTGLAPAIMQVYYLAPFHNEIGILLAVSIGTVIGFILIPITKHTAKINTGHNLYNSGFSSGLVSMLLMAFFRGVGINFTTNSMWSSGNNDVITVFLIVISSFLLLAGIFTTYDIKQLFKKIILDIFSKEYQEETESIRSYLYINMGVLGFFCCIFMHLLKVELSGPVLGGIFTIIGFGCCGKSLKNIFPIMVGATIAGSITVYGLETPSVIIAILFSTCLAPIVRDYGVIWGIIAGMVHVTLVMSSGDFYGGLNLYNNGLAGGIVAILLVPLIEATNRRKEISKESKETVMIKKKAELSDNLNISKEAENDRYDNVTES